MTEKSKQKLVSEVREFRPWTKLNPTAPTTKEIYKKIYEARIRGVRLVGPQDYFGGVSALPAIALKPHEIDPSWELKPHEQLPSYSFVIPTYSQPEFLTSVLRQLSKLNAPKGSWEVIVVDDGSPNDMLSRVKSYLCDEELGYNLRYFYWKKPQKIFRAGEARNLGAGKALGTTLVFVDSDMLVPPHFLSEVESSLGRSTLVQFVREHIQPEKSNVHTTYDSVPEQDRFIEEKNYWKPFFDSENWEDLPYFWKYTCSYALAIRKFEFDATRGFNPCFTTYGFEDTDLGYRLYKNSKRFELNKTPLLHLSSRSTESGWVLKVKRQEALSKTAKIFFLAHLDPEIYEHFQFYMMDSGVWLSRLINFLRQKIDLQSKSKDLSSES